MVVIRATHRGWEPLIRHCTATWKWLIRITQEQLSRSIMSRSGCRLQYREALWGGHIIAPAKCAFPPSLVVKPLALFVFLRKG